MQATTNPTQSDAKLDFAFPADVSACAGQYEVYAPHNGADRTSYEVCDASGITVDLVALRETFIADMRKPSRPIEWVSDGDEFDDSSMDYANRLALTYLKDAPGADPFARTYLAFAKDDSDRVVGYTAASVSLAFFLPDGSFDEVEFDDVWTWLTTSKRRNLKAYLRVNLQETYTLAECRGAGASTATMDYISNIVHALVQDLVEALQEPLRNYRKTLNFDFELYSEWESKSGCLASGTLLSELEVSLMGLREEFRAKDSPVKLPKAWGYDAGF